MTLIWIKRKRFRRKIKWQRQKDEINQEWFSVQENHNVQTVHIIINKAIRRIIRDCNDEQLLKDENAKVLLPHFSCHSLRHTFTTRMCEAGVNVKVIQDTLGHKDISTTLNIYTDVTKELRRSEFEGLDSYFKNEYNKANEVL